MAIDLDLLKNVNIRRRRDGKKALTHDQANLAVANNSALDTLSLLTTYTMIDAATVSSTYDTRPLFSGDGGSFGGAGASGDF